MHNQILTNTAKTMFITITNRECKIKVKQVSELSKVLFVEIPPTVEYIYF